MDINHRKYTENEKNTRIFHILRVFSVMYVHLNQLPQTVSRNISSRCSSKSETKASELLENLKEMFAL